MYSENSHRVAKGGERLALPSSLSNGYLFIYVRRYFSRGKLIVLNVRYAKLEFLQYKGVELNFKKLFFQMQLFGSWIIPAFSKIARSAAVPRFYDVSAVIVSFW